MARSLAGKNAIVTGGARGLGVGIALELARRGANIVLTYNASSREAQNIVAEIEKLGTRAVAVQASGTDRDSPSRIIKAAVDNFGVIDIIVNNAGAGDDCLLTDLTYELWDKIMDTNLRMPTFIIKAALPHLGSAPRIVNISSVTSQSGPSWMTAYAASKGALESATRVWASELGQKYNATFNCVSPGPIATDMWLRDSDPGVLAEWEPKIQATPAAPRIATVDDVAQIVAFYCEEGSRWATGCVVPANGGLLYQ